MLPGSETHPYYLREIWGLYIFGSIIFALRFIVRFRTVGIRGTCGDDLFAMIVWVMYTVDAVVVDRAYTYGTNIDFTLEQLESMTPSQLHTISKGSKFELVAWFSYSALIWATKATMLFFYQRLTFGLWQRRLVKWLAVACGLTYVAVLFTIFLGCRPFNHNWQVLPQPGLQCSFRMQNVATVSAFNIITDVALLSIPLPLLWHLQIPKRQKIVVAVFLMTGFLVIAAAVIRIVITLGSHPSTTTVNLWGVRETIVALICVNTPMLRPLFNRSFWSGNFKDSNNGSSLRSRGLTGRGGGETQKGDAPSTANSKADDVMNDGSSEEYIMKNMVRENVNQVHVEVEVQVERHDRRGADGRDVELGTTAMTFPQTPSSRWR